jgi:hypothetical protein
MADYLRHGSGFILSGDKRAYPTHAYRLIDIVTNEPIRIGERHNAITFDLDEALSALSISSRCVLEIIECYHIANPG